LTASRTTGTLLVLLLAAAGSHAAAVHDDLGHSVALAQPAQRIVTLAPHATELVVAAGAGARLAGIAAGGTNTGSLSALPRIGGPGALDREALLALRPDLVIAWHTGNRATDLDWIERSGMPLYRSEPRSLRDVALTIRNIGELSGNPRQAGAAARAFEQQLNTACAELPAQAAYVMVWERPAMSVGGRHWINDVLRAAGYRNAFAHLERGVFKVAPEAAYRYREMPVISLVRGGDRAGDDQLADLLSRPGPRLGEAVQQLCRRRLRLDAPVAR